MMVDEYKSAGMVLESSGNEVPLCVDLDGTLLRTDTLHESVLVMLKTQPWLALCLPIWLSRGRAYLKREITRRAELDVANLPVNEDLHAHLQQQYRNGRQIILVTAADEKLGRAVAEHFGCFEDVMTSDGTRNLSAGHKAEALNSRFGRGGFDYAGNAPADLPVWSIARRAIVVNANRRTVQKAKQAGNVDHVLSAPNRRLATLFRAIRPHQWAKNTLLFLPLLGAHAWHDAAKLRAVGLAFVAFSLCSSSVYVLNDLFDLRSDRLHPNKRKRPFASGALPVSWGSVLSPMLLIAAILVASLLPVPFLAAFGIYYLITLSYSLRLKQFGLIDVFVLASLYGLRVIAGGVVADVAVSDWLLIFCMFLFVSLALAKRFTEIKVVRESTEAAIAGRGYTSADSDVITKMGIASGYIAVVILALYVTNPAVAELYVRPACLLFACPALMYWISRIWLLAERGQLHDDPIVFAFTDKESWFCVVAVLIAILASLPK